MQFISEIPFKEIEKNKLKLNSVMKGNNKIIVTAEWPGKLAVSQESALDDADAQFAVILENCNNKFIAVKHGFDNIPCANLDFGGVAWLMSLAYGCALIRIGGRINSKPLYSSIEEAAKMKEITRIYEHGLYPVITERILKFQEMYPEIPITIPDNQSPIDVLTCILHSEAAMYAMFDDGEAVHSIMDIITNSIIEVNRYYEKTIKNFGGFRAGTWQSIGMHLADDNAAFLSPSVYQEYAIPYVNRIVNEFGNVNFHCCMGYAQNLENMALIKGFTGYDAHPDFNPQDRIISAIKSNRASWEVFNFPWSRKDDREYPDIEMFKKAINASENKCSMIITVYDGDKDTALKMADEVKNYVVLKGRDA